jgi:acyl carrier protein
VISQSLREVLLAELKLKDFDFHETTLATEVPGWDSLRHISIIAAVEKRFEIRFKSLEVIRLKNIGELQALVDKKLAARSS